MSSIPFTPQAYAQLKADFAKLKKERKEIIARLQTAREMGDLSENGAYKYAKMELGDNGRNQRRIRHLLEEGHVVEPTDHSVVEFGSTVRIRGPRGEQTVLIVSEHESDPKQFKLAMTSPIGKALIGKKPGDTVTAETPGGTVSYSILAIG